MTGRSVFSQRVGIQTSNTIFVRTVIGLSKRTLQDIHALKHVLHIGSPFCPAVSPKNPKASVRLQDLHARLQMYTTTMDCTENRFT